VSILFLQILNSRQNNNNYYYYTETHTCLRLYMYQDILVQSYSAKPEKELDKCLM